MSNGMMLNEVNKLIAGSYCIDVIENINLVPRVRIYEECSGISH